MTMSFFHEVLVFIFDLLSVVPVAVKKETRFICKSANLAKNPTLQNSLEITYLV